MRNNNGPKTLPCVYIYTVQSEFHSLSGHFPGGPGLAGTKMSPFWILLKLRVMEVVVTASQPRRRSIYHAMLRVTRVMT